MNKSRSRTKLVAALVAGAAIRIFFFPDAPGLVSTALIFGLGAVILSLLYVPWLTGIRWLTTVRDVGIVFGVNILIGTTIGVIVIVMTESESVPKNSLAVANIASALAGFVLVGILTRQDRIAHLVRVAVCVWLLSGLQFIFVPENWTQWIGEFFLTCALMWAGYGISLLLRKTTQDQGNPEQPGTAGQPAIIPGPESSTQSSPE